MSPNPERHGLLDWTANPRLLAWFRLCVGAAAFAKGIALGLLGAPTILVVPWVILAAYVTAGLAARAAAAGLIVLGVPLLFIAYRNHLYLLWLLLILVCISDCQRCYAVRKQGDGPVAGWPLLLMRAQATVVYFYAGLGKVNAEFLDGSVFRYYFERAVLPFPGLSASAVSLAFMAVTAEIAMSVFLWIPRLRPWGFGIAVPLHIGMLAVATSWMVAFEIVLFALLMFSLFPAFLRLDEESFVVTWNDSCPLSRRTIAIFRRLNGFGTIRFVKANATETADLLGPLYKEVACLRGVRPDGTTAYGFDAVRSMLAVIPFGFLAAPWLALPGIKHIGGWFFRADETQRQRQ